MSERSGPRKLSRSFIAQVFQGIGYPLEAVGFMRRHRLWRLALVPTIVNILLFAGVVAGLSFVALPWVHALQAWLAPADPNGFFAGMISVLAIVIWLVAAVMALVAGAFVLVMIGQAVASPFLDVLSEKVETIVLSTTAEPATVGRVVRAVMISLGDLVWSVLIWVAGTVPLMLLNALPVVGNAGAVALEFAFGALLLAQEFMGLSLARQLVSYPARWRVMWANKWMALGFGASTTVLLLVPGLNLVLLPLAAVGGTLLYCDLEAAGRVRPALRTPSAKVGDRVLL